jgi:hypothetical protein
MGVRATDRGSSIRDKEALEWFRSLPVWMDFPGLRVVHACWNNLAQEAVANCLDDAHRFTRVGFHEASRPRSKAYKAAEVLLKGPEVSLLDGRFFSDKDGHKRNEVPIRWWDPEARRSIVATLTQTDSRRPDGIA